jgi:phenylacetate-CoA ligase
MFVRPSQVAEVLSRHSEITKGRLILERKDDADAMTLHCELQIEPSVALEEAVASTIRNVCNLRSEVVFVAAGSLVNDGKVIDDLRPVEV